jgi:hypothetical protein
MLMAAGQGAGDRKALKDLSTIYRDGIGVAADSNESLLWAAVLDLMDNIASAGQVLRELGYPQGFTGVVLSSGSPAAARNNTRLIDEALRMSLQQRPGFLAELCSCCFQTSVRTPAEFLRSPRSNPYACTSHLRCR